MTNRDPVMEPIFTKMMPCPGVGSLKMIPCSAARPRSEKYMSTPPPPRDLFDHMKKGLGRAANSGSLGDVFYGHQHRVIVIVVLIFLEIVV